MNGRTQFSTLLILSALGCNLALAQSSTATYSYSGPALPLYYTTGSAATLMQFNVPADLSINSVTTTISVSYPTTGDLNVYLFGPDGTRTILVEKNCGSQGILINMTFDDNAAQMYNSFCPASPGSYRGNQPLSNYKGKNSAGTWTLAVQNNTTPGAFGTVTAFSLTINGNSLTPPTITALANAVSLAMGAISPGELIGVSGVNIGPPNGVISTASTLPTTLGGVQLMINNQAIPLYYASSTLIAGVVPYQAIPGNPAVIGGQVTVTAVYNGVTSNGIVSNLTTSSPALWTTSDSITGNTSAKAFNQDGTLNSSSNPAAVGSYISLYASGLGAVTPAGFQAGTTAPTSQLYTVNGPTFVSITGQSATVSFAGLAPGQISIYQVNAQIPAGTPSGQQPVFLSNMVGGSQNNLTIWVK